MFTEHALQYMQKLTYSFVSTAMLPKNKYRCRKKLKTINWSLVARVLSREQQNLLVMKSTADIADLGELVRKWTDVRWLVALVGHCKRASVCVWARDFVCVRLFCMCLYQLFHTAWRCIVSLSVQWGVADIYKYEGHS